MTTPGPNPTGLGGLLLLQPAFLGDVVLSTALLESWHRVHPDDTIRVVVRKGAEGLFQGHPFVDQVLVWDRQGWLKYPRLLALGQRARAQRPDQVVNLHRYSSMAWLTKRVGAPKSSVFEGVSLSVQGAYFHPHNIGDGRHETQRNHAHISDAVGAFNAALDRPQLYPRDVDRAAASSWPDGAVILAPSSVWATKRWPAKHWSTLVNQLHAHWPHHEVVLLGGSADRSLLEEIASKSDKRPAVCAGELSLLGSAALMSQAKVVVSNDSAPLHMAGAVQCPAVGVFCSTTPALGFGVLPQSLADGSGANVELASASEGGLDCKPCGLHGFKQCPKGHFKCGLDLSVREVMNAVVRVSSLPS